MNRSMKWFQYSNVQTIHIVTEKPFLFYMMMMMMIYFIYDVTYFPKAFHCRERNRSFL